MIRTNVNNDQLPGVQSERTLTLGKEIRRDDIFDNGTYVGQVVYVSRKTSTGTMYGWRPAKSAAQSRLMIRVDAIRTLLPSQ